MTQERLRRRTERLNAERLKRLRGVEDVVFHQLLTPAQVSETQDFDIPAMLKEAEATLDAFDGSIDAIVGYIDFPVSTMLPLLCKKYGTPQASLESLLKCEHKYWSRSVMREAIPEHMPKFTAFDPFDDNALSKIGEADLRFPFFVKPIKSSGSRLGFRIDSPEDFDFAIEKLRAEIGTDRRALRPRARARRTCPTKSARSRAITAWPSR